MKTKITTKKSDKEKYLERYAPLVVEAPPVKKPTQASETLLLHEQLKTGSKERVKVVKILPTDPQAMTGMFDPSVSNFISREVRVSHMDQLPLSEPKPPLKKRLWENYV